MTEVKMLKGVGWAPDGEEKLWLVLDVEGHAQYAPKGKDIVCAAESMLVQALGAMLAGMGEQALEEFDVSGKKGSGCTTITAMPRKGCEDRVKGAFECVRAGFDLLARQYPQNVKLDLQFFAGGDGGEAAAPEQEVAPKVELSRAELRQAKAAGTYREENPLAAVRYGVQEPAGAEADGIRADKAAGAAAGQPNAGTPAQAMTEPLRAQEQEPPQQGEPEAEEGPAFRPMPDARRARVQAIQADWARQEARMQQVYPEFRLSDAKADPAFTSLLLRGVPLRQAYEAAHFQELMGRAVEHTARTVERGMAARIESRGLRAAENGTRPGGAAVTKTDVNSLSRADREEIERRVLHGEKIRF